MVSKQFDFIQKSKGVFPFRRTILFKEKKRCNRPMNGLIMINSRDETLFGELVHLNDDRPISDERLRGVHISRVKRCVALIHPLDFHPTITIRRGVHRSRLISAIITPLINGQDQFT